MSETGRQTGRGDAAAFDAADAFARGNYSRVAACGGAADWRTHAALGLIGRTDAALVGLSAFDHDLARFYEAVARWVGGDDDGAAQGLERLTDPHARALLALIRRSRINVLCQLPPNRSGPHVHLVGAQADPRFSISNISTHPDDLPLRPYASIQDYRIPGQAPDLFVCEMVEWHQIPPDFPALGCPSIGVTSDFDLHVQGIHPWLRAFDEIVVNDHTEHDELSPTVDVPVSVFPLLFGCSPGLPAPTDRLRELDVFMSGSLFESYHPDKVALLQRVLADPGLRVSIVNGHIHEDAYFDLLSRSKVTLSYYRRPGGMVTRGIEAACMGCVTLLQEGSVVGLYANPINGFVYYDSTPEGLARSLAMALANYPSLSEAARVASRSMRETFAPAAVSSRFFRFCAFLASRPRLVRSPPEGLFQKRNMFWKGWPPGNRAPGFARRLCEENVRRLSASADQSSSAGNDLARELLLEVGADLMGTPHPLAKAERLATAFEALRATVRRHPRALVPRFNFLRAVVHFGSSQERAEGMDVAAATFDADRGEWQLDALDDVFPYDFASDHFNYRKYIDDLRFAMSPDGVCDPAAIPDLVRLILASMHHYMALCLDDPVHAEVAADLDPDPRFPWYRFDLARRLLSTKRAPQAIASLSELALSSMLTVPAAALLRRAAEESAAVPELARIVRHVDRFETSVVDTQARWFKASGGYFQTQSPRPGGFGPRTLKLSSTVGSMISVVLVDDHRRDLRPAMRALRAMESVEIVLVEATDAPTAEAAALADAIVVLNDTELAWNVPAAQNAGLIEASGSIAILIDGDGQGVVHLIEAARSRVGSRFALCAWSESGGVRAIACRTTDALLCGGLEQHESQDGPYADLGEFADRLRHFGVRVETLDGGLVTQPMTRPRGGYRLAIWPQLNAGGPRRRPHRGMPGLVEAGLRRFIGTEDGWSLLRTEGFDILPYLDRQEGTIRTAQGVGVPTGLAACDALIARSFPASRHPLTLTVRGHGDVSAAIRIVVGVVSREVAGVELHRGVELPFVCAETCDIVVRHLGGGGWALSEARLHATMQRAPELIGDEG